MLRTSIACLALALAIVPSTAAPAARLPGHIWHSFSDLSNPQGTFSLDPNSGANSMIDRKRWAVPWPGGNHYIHDDYIASGSGDDETRLFVRRSADRHLVAERRMDGDFDDIRPAPVKSWILADWGRSTIGPKRSIVVDIAKQKLLFAAPESKTPDAFSWMPDESLLRATPAGQISRFALGSPEKPVASVKWPEGRFLQAIYASPDGTRLLAQLAALRDTGSVSGVDLWIMNIDGSGLARFTNNGLITNAFWSPDSRYIAFTKDTGTSCSDATCRGSCTVWYAPATARNVVAVDASRDAYQFPLKRPDGSMRMLGCPMTAWIP